MDKLISITVEKIEHAYVSPELKREKFRFNRARISKNQKSVLNW